MDCIWLFILYIYIWIVYDCLYYIYMDCIWLYRIGLGSVDIREESGENKNVLKKCVFLGKKVFSFCSWNTGSLFFARPSSTRSRFFRGHCEGQIRWVLLSFHLPHKDLQVYHGLSRSYVSSSTPSLLCSSASSPIHHGQLARQPPLLSQARQLSVGNRRARALLQVLRPCQRECRNILYVRYDLIEHQINRHMECLPEGKADKISLRMPDRMSDNISDGMPDEDVTQDAN